MISGNQCSRRMVSIDSLRRRSDAQAALPAQEVEPPYGIHKKASVAMTEHPVGSMIRCRAVVVLHARA